MYLKSAAKMELILKWIQIARYSNNTLKGEIRILPIPFFSSLKCIYEWLIFRSTFRKLHIPIGDEILHRFFSIPGNSGIPHPGY